MIILQKKANGISPAALNRFLASARAAAGLEGHVSVVIAAGSTLRRLNRQFRGKDHITDVLSFPAAFQPGSKRQAAGEIVISAEVAARSAKALGHSVADEIKVLILHGVLHLAGYDHERDSGEMAGLEQRLRHRFRLPAALTERSRQ